MRALVSCSIVNAWQLQRGDRIGVAPTALFIAARSPSGFAGVDGDGGAIAFGDRDGDSCIVRQRWFPHLGDACLFTREDDTWHSVEAVRSDVV